MAQRCRLLVTAAPTKYVKMLALDLISRLASVPANRAILSGSRCAVVLTDQFEKACAYL